MPPSDTPEPFDENGAAAPLGEHSGRASCTVGTARGDDAAPPEADRPPSPTPFPPHAAPSAEAPETTRPRSPYTLPSPPQESQTAATAQQPSAPPSPHSPPASRPNAAAKARPSPESPQEPYSQAYAAPAEEPQQPAAASPGKPRRFRKGPAIGIVSAVVVLALIGGGVSWYVLTMPEPEDAAASYIDAWNSQDYAAMAALATGDGLEDTYTEVQESLGIEKSAVTLGTVAADGDTATAPFETTLSLSNAGDWSYTGEIPLTRVDDEWKVDFSPAVIHPDLGDGQTLTRTNEWGERGHILAADGARLDTDDVSGSIKMIVGQVGTAAEEDLERLGPAYEVGDPTGVGGIQQAYEERLAGTATTTIRVVDAGEGDAAEAEGEDSTVIGEIDGSDGKDVTTGLDLAVQNAAAQAVSGQSKATALVAVRPSTGEVLAVANLPGGFNRAVEGQYPAGSAFKIVTYEALLSNGLGMDEGMNCPKNAEIGGWPFKNAGDAAYGAQSVTESFATSCNTALVQKVAERLDSSALVSTAEQFGFNSELETGISGFDPVFPAPDNITMLAASSIGQGDMLTSPMHMATVPAAVADGSWRSPVFVTDPENKDRPDPTPIANAENLRTMMRAVVTEGTAKDVGFTGEVHGKSGTAEYGTAEEGEELPTHAWFVGYENDVAFAVLVEDGSGGAADAAPLAKRFLEAL